MINFNNVTNIMIPEGNVKQIVDSYGNILWQQYKTYSLLQILNNINIYNEVKSWGHAEETSLTAQEYVDNIIWNEICKVGRIKSEIINLNDCYQYLDQIFVNKYKVNICEPFLQYIYEFLNNKKMKELPSSVGNWKDISTIPFIGQKPGLSNLDHYYYPGAGFLIKSFNFPAYYCVVDLTSSTPNLYRLYLGVIAPDRESQIYVSYDYINPDPKYNSISHRTNVAIGYSQQLAGANGYARLVQPYMLFGSTFANSDEWEIPLEEDNIIIGRDNALNVLANNSLISGGLKYTGEIYLFNEPLLNISTDIDLTFKNNYQTINNITYSELHNISPNIMIEPSKDNIWIQ